MPRPWALEGLEQSVPSSYSYVFPSARHPLPKRTGDWGLPAERCSGWWASAVGKPQFEAELCALLADGPESLSRSFCPLSGSISSQRRQQG